MLLSLSLRDFVIVDALELSFDEGFTVITGETGAGKSIILDALGLLLGDKADFSQVRQGAQAAQLSALFSLERLPEIRRSLAEQGFAEDGAAELALRRIIDAKGRSRNFINGQSATLAQMKKIGESLIDIHGQNAHQSLNRDPTQRHILDAFSGSLNAAEKVKTAYRAWQDAQNALAAAQNQAENLQREQELLAWQQQEFAKVAPQAGEWENLSQSYDILANAADLLTAAEQCRTYLDGETGVQMLLARCRRQLSAYAQIAPQFGESLAILDSVEAELGEIDANLRHVADHVEIDADELSRQEARLAELSALAKKYRVDAERLPEKFSAINEELAHLAKAADIAQLHKAAEKAGADYAAAAAELSRLRAQGAEKFSREVAEVLHTLSMEKARFQAALIDSEPSAHGNERVQFQVAVNAGGSLQPVAKVASGGELARISLAVQVAGSRYLSVPTLVFDEVDSGIGGRVAEVVGKRLRAIGEKYQVLAVTHLAQVAACANQHWQVGKYEQNGQTFSKIHILDEKTRVEEIARMIGGEVITATTRQHAAEMLAAGG